MSFGKKVFLALFVTVLALVALDELAGVVRIAIEFGKQPQPLVLPLRSSSFRTDRHPHGLLGQAGCNTSAPRVILSSGRGVNFPVASKVETLPGTWCSRSGTGERAAAKPPERGPPINPPFYG